MRDKIKLESSAGTGHFYTTTKNKRTMPGKLEIKKFDPVARNTLFNKETKIEIIRFLENGKASVGQGLFYLEPYMFKVAVEIYKRSSEIKGL